MAKEPGQRYQAPVEVAKALAGFCNVGEVNNSAEEGTGRGEEEKDDLLGRNDDSPLPSSRVSLAGSQFAGRGRNSASCEQGKRAGSRIGLGLGAAVLLVVAVASWVAYLAIRDVNRTAGGPLPSSQRPGESPLDSLAGHDSPVPAGRSPEPQQLPDSQPPVALIDPLSQMPSPKSAHIDLYGDPLPPGAIARMGTVRFSHRDIVRAFAFSPNGRLLATGCDDKVVRLWDAASGKVIREFCRHDLGDQCQPEFAAFSPDGRICATGWYGGSVILWDVATGKEIGNIHADNDDTFFVSSLAFSPDGKTLALCAGANHVVSLFDVASSKLKLELRGHRVPVYFMAFSPDGKQITTVSLGNPPDAVRTWETASGREIGHFEVPKGWYRIALSADGTILAYQEVPQKDDKRAITTVLWDLAKGKEIHRLTTSPDHSGESCCVISADGKTLAAPGEATFLLWEMATGKEIGALELGQHNYHDLRLRSFSPDGRALALQSWNTILLWDVASGKEIDYRPQHVGRIASLAYSPDGKRVASASEDRTVRVWNAATGKQVQLFQGHEMRCNA